MKKECPSDLNDPWELNEWELHMMSRMKTDEIIRGLRDLAKSVNKELLTEAADRLEELDERVAIMEEGTEHDRREGKTDRAD